MGKRDKRLKKQIEGIERQIELHLEKLRTESGEKDTTHDYWRKEIELKFERARRDRVGKMGRKKSVG